MIVMRACRAAWLAGLMLIVQSAVAAQAPNVIAAQAPNVIAAQAPNTVVPAPPATAPAPVTAPAQASPAPLTEADVGAWADGYMIQGIKQAKIAGAVLVVVKDGAVLFQRGYGYADVAAKKPVDPRTTLFRPGSISKLFTWTAVMQLVEQGKLDLDRDITAYLDFPIPPYAGKPITLRNIMTHSAGFEEVAGGIITQDPARLIGLRAALTKFIPSRILPPGEINGYSNYATALAGYIVERVSGEEFAHYIDAHILTPLRMHASFAQPLPASLAPDASLGYQTIEGDAQKYELIPLSPAGALAASGEAMAHFMIAHLQDGAYGDARILKPETARQMHDTLTHFVPGVNGLALGWGQADLNGQRVLTHGGDTIYFHSDLWIFLDAHVGLYVSFNSPGEQGGAEKLRSFLIDAFADRYFPHDPHDGTVDAATARAHAATIAGHYLVTRRAEDTPIALLNLVGQINVVAKPDGNVTAFGKTFHEIAPYLWREDRGKARLTVSLENGKPKFLAVEPYSWVMAFQPAPAAINQAWVKPVGLAALAVLDLTVLAWPVLAFARWRFRAPFPLSGAAAWTYRLARIGALAFVTGFVLLAIPLSGLETGEDPSPAIVTACLGLIIFAVTALTAGAAGEMLTAWTQPAGWGRRLWTALLLPTACVLTWLAWQGGLLTLNPAF